MWKPARACERHLISLPHSSLFPFPAATPLVLLTYLPFRVLNFKQGLKLPFAPNRSPATEISSPTGLSAAGWGTPGDLGSSLGMGTSGEGSDLSRSPSSKWPFSQGEMISTTWREL